VKKVLFIGSFLSKHDGSLSYGESLAKQLNGVGFKCILISNSEIKFIRLFEIIFSLLVYNGRVVHIDIFSGNAFHIAEIASRIAHLRRKMIVMTLRGGKLTEFYECNPAKVNFVLKRADILQTPSLFLQSYFYMKGYNIKRLPNAVDLLKFTYERSNVKKHSILWIRAFTEIYNPGLAVSAIYEICKKYPDTTLTMVGPDKGLLHEVQKKVNDLGIDNSITFTGPLPNDELVALYQEHEVYINTTSYESFGNAMFEAASCGTPIVSSAVGEIPLLWKGGEDVLLIEKLDAGDFAKAIIRLFDNKDLAGHISKNARTKAEDFGWDKIRLQWVSMLEEAYS